ncbi:uncharacterized protein DDB_G0271670, partial [Aplysia californica]|uniref:Uncharacterized protein DDB_G0271670 n=1 Tax=Aplysia californica TaxID=6500 RepID=A0ABM0ZVQ8_APLCA
MDFTWSTSLHLNLICIFTVCCGFALATVCPRPLNSHVSEGEGDVIPDHGDLVGSETAGSLKKDYSVCSGGCCQYAVDGCCRESEKASMAYGATFLGMTLLVGVAVALICRKARNRRCCASGTQNRSRTQSETDSPPPYSACVNMTSRRENSEEPTSRITSHDNSTPRDDLSPTLTLQSTTLQTVRSGVRHPHHLPAPPAYKDIFKDENSEHLFEVAIVRRAGEVRFTTHTQLLSELKSQEQESSESGLSPVTSLSPDSEMGEAENSTVNNCVPRNTPLTDASSVACYDNAGFEEHRTDECCKSDRGGDGNNNTNGNDGRGIIIASSNRSSSTTTTTSSSSSNRSCYNSGSIHSSTINGNNSSDDIVHRSSSSSSS